MHDYDLSALKLLTRLLSPWLYESLTVDTISVRSHYMVIPINPKLAVSPNQLPVVNAWVLLGIHLSSPHETLQ